MRLKIKIVYIISNLSQGGAQILLFDILDKLMEKIDLELSVITIDSGDYIKNFEDRGIRVIDLNEKGLINLKIYKKLKKYIKKIKPDIVHTHLLKADFYGRIAAKNSGVPLIISTCHNYSTHHEDADLNKKSKYDLIDNFVIKYSHSKIIAISELVRKYLMIRNPDFGKDIVVIYNGVDLDKRKYILNSKSKINEFRKSLGFSESDFVINISGRLEKQKGHLFFLKTIAKLLKENINVKVLIVGDGSLRQRIQDFVSENLFEEQVRLVGFVSNSEEYFEISDLICVPSLWEGFGLVIIEGMVKRKIVLASKVGGIPEIVIDGQNGYLFESENSENLLDKLQFIHKNFEDLEHIKLQALQTAESKFDVNKTSEDYYDFYIQNFTKN